jgi:hypothetical protein
VDVIGLDGQFLDMPPQLSALAEDQLAAGLGNLPREDGLSTLRTPDEVVDDQVNPMFVALIFNVDSILTIDGLFKSDAARRRVETRPDKPRLTSPTKVGRLAAGFFGQRG